jgi:HEAT repeat protein
VFSLSQSGVADAYARIVRISRDDASADVRGQALFWMAQMRDPRARDDILAALGRESSREVQERAVFALSQLEDPRASATLIDIVRGDYPRFVKEKALFWLGQSGSEEAMAFLEAVLTK